MDYFGKGEYFLLVASGESTLMCDFDKWIIEKMDFTKGVNEKLE